MRRPFAGALRVLIVEDQPLHAARVEEILTEAGYLTIGPLHTVEAVVKGLSQAAFDVALIDTDLRGLPIDAILDLLGHRGIPAVFMSEHGHSPQGKAPQRTSVLKKPVQPEGLLGAIRDSLATRASAEGGHRAAQI